MFEYQNVRTVASYSRGVRTRQAKRTAAPAPVGGRLGTSTYNNSVIPGKDGKLIEASDKIPSSSDVASYEDAERED